MIGCGDECLQVWLADHRTGRLSDFPVSGGDYIALRLAFTPTSREVAATWQVQQPSIA